MNVKNTDSQKKRILANFQIMYVHIVKIEMYKLYTYNLQ